MQEEAGGPERIPEQANRSHLGQVTQRGSARILRNVLYESGKIAVSNQLQIKNFIESQGRLREQNQQTCCIEQ
jgi:hypothetical protein